MNGTGGIRSNLLLHSHGVKGSEQLDLSSGGAGLQVQSAAFYERIIRQRLLI